MRLRLLVKHYCETMQLLREDLEKSLLVPGREVIRYHADSESEDEEKDEAEDKNERPIVVDNEEMTPRYMTCDHCGEEFDVTKNERGDCLWHPGSFDQTGFGRLFPDVL
jgi:hypothetical protein